MQSVPIMYETAMENRRRKLVYITPALYMAGGVERVLTLKANYFAENFGYDITVILTDGKGKPFFYPLSDKVQVVNLDINFEDLWTCSFAKKVFVYLRKQREFKRKLGTELMRIRPDITISLLRREINFINAIKDGSKKIGELHVNRQNYRNYEANDANFIKRLFARYWMKSLVRHLKKLDRFIVLTEEDKHAWNEIRRIDVLPDPLPFHTEEHSRLDRKRVIAVGRYVYQKGFDLLLQAWARVEKQCPDWELAIFGTGDREPYIKIARELNIDMSRCTLNGSTRDIKKEYLGSSLFVFSSRFEGFGMVLVEAMACGVPVISFDCPCGPKDIITSDVDGILVPGGNVALLSEKMEQLMTDDAQLRQLSTNAIAKAQKYEMHNLALRWKALFDELCLK